MLKLPTLVSLILLMTATGAFAQPPATPPPVSNAQTVFQQELSQARAAYFRGLQGNSSAEKKATQDFHKLETAHPDNPVVMAYSGSLLLLKAARIWAFWDKRSLAQQGLAELDKAVSTAPDSLEARFIRGASTWHLPFFFHRKDQSEQDLTFVAVRAKQAVKQGRLPPQLGAAALDYYGKILLKQSHPAEAQKAFREATNVDPDSPGGRDAASHLSTEG